MPIHINPNLIMYSISSIIGILFVSTVCMIDDPPANTSPDPNANLDPSQQLIDVSNHDTDSFYIIDFEKAMEGGELDTQSTDYTSLDFIQIDSTLHANFWIEKGKHTQENMEIVYPIADMFEEKIYTPVTEQFAVLSDLDKNQIIHVLFVELPGESSKMVGGFFDPVQLTGFDQALGGEVIYVNLGLKQQFEIEGMGTYLTDEQKKAMLFSNLGGILAHEFQHACYFNQNAIIEDGMNPLSLTTQEDVVALNNAMLAQQDLWLNEGMSQMAIYAFEGYGATLQNYWMMYDMNMDLGGFSDLLGFSDLFDDGGGAIGSSVSKIENGYPLFPFWNGMNDYTLVTMFFLYMMVQSDCEDVWSKIITHESETIDAVIDVARQCSIIEEDEGIKTLLGNWLVANLVLQLECAEINPYGYNRKINNTWWDPSQSLMPMQGPYPSELRDEASLFPGGALYFPIHLDTPFEPTTIPEHIAYIGYNKQECEADTDPTDGVSGDIVIVYNYDGNPDGLPITVSIPSNDEVRTSEEKGAWKLDVQNFNMPFALPIRRK